MACGSLSLTGSPVTAALKLKGNLSRSSSTKDLYSKQARMRRSYSDNEIRIRATSAAESKLKAVPPSPAGIFNFQFSNSFLSNSIKSLFFDPDGTRRGSNVDENFKGSDDDVEVEQEKKRANWVEQVLEIKTRWREKKDVACDTQIPANKNEEEACNNVHGAEEDYCQVDYSDESDIKVDKESFRELLKGVSSSHTKLFSKLAYLCNLAYIIPDIKAMDLRRYYALEFVTSSLLKKEEPVAVKDALDKASKIDAGEMDSPLEKRVAVHQPSVAYQIAASAASYVQSRAKDLLSLGSKPQMEISDEVTNDCKEKVDEEHGPASSRVHKSEIAAYVAASTMTAVVAADEKQKQETARNLQSLHNSPCEWFVCDDCSYDDAGFRLLRIMAGKSFL